MDTAPHGLLFPRCKVIVHHGHLADDGMLPQVGRCVLLQLRPVMDVTQMWRLICVNNSWDAWGIMKKSSRKITPPICRHLFACLSKPQSYWFFISRIPVMKIQGGAGTLNASALSGIPTVTGRDSELMVFSSWMMDDKGLRRHFDVVQKCMYHREFIYRCFDHFWSTLDTLRHLLVHSIIDNWQVFREWSVTHSLQSLCLLEFNEISNGMEPYGTPNGPTNVGAFLILAKNAMNLERCPGPRSLFQFSWTNSITQTWLM